MLKSAKTGVNVIAHQLFGRQKRESAVNFFKKVKESTTETAYFHWVFVILQPKTKPYTNMKISKTTFIFALYDKDLYNGLVASQFMIDNADPYHNWRLTKHSSVIVNSQDESIRSIQILTENPYTSTNAEIVAESIIFGFEEELSYTVSVLTNELYAVAYDVYGNDLGYTKFAYNAFTLELSLNSLTKPGTIAKRNQR